jgi:hypothetical protein
MGKWFIIHFQPLEKYPPVINFIRFAQQQGRHGNELHVITTHPGDNKPLIHFQGVHIYYAGKWKNRNRFLRLFFYIEFNIKSLWLLIRFRADNILYYETLSAFGPCFYKKYINRRAPIFIHYHEYTSKTEYENGMALNRWLHKKEKSLYQKTAWVSHTNEQRLNLFLKDVLGQKPPHTYILPNYPPASWYKKAMGAVRDKDKRIAFVYVGALSLETMYTRQMAGFIAKHAGDCYWDIYSDNHDSDAVDFLKSLNATNIFFKGGVAYDELPDILPAYDIGVILYNGNTLNYRYNAPNKFFEYLICGLNVWYPITMETMQQYEQARMKPWVRCVDFDKLIMCDNEDAYRTTHIPEPVYVAETVYERLLTATISEM